MMTAKNQSWVIRISAAMVVMSTALQAGYTPVAAFGIALIVDVLYFVRLLVNRHHWVDMLQDFESRFGGWL